MPTALVEDERIKKLSFTGSTEVGWELRDRARKKHVTLELGGNAACIIERDADLDVAVERNVFGGYYQSGQSCISVQRIFVHESIYDAFRTKFVAAVKALKMGDPREEDTFIGPMISEEEAKRIERTIQDAVRRAASCYAAAVARAVWSSRPCSKTCRGMPRHRARKSSARSRCLLHFRISHKRSSW